MKNIIKITLLLFACTLLLNACKKENIIFKNEFMHTWYLQKYEENGVDKTQEFDSVYHNYTLTFDNVKNYATDEYDDIFIESFYHHGTLFVEYYGFFQFLRPDKLKLQYSGSTYNTKAFTIEFVNKGSDEFIINEVSGITTKRYSFRK
ncbi:MAG: hypothetical protein H6553_05620 [Chitinophagales bacterium]|nr:hypothetical protein [Chitinophagales bacterium]